MKTIGPKMRNKRNDLNAIIALIKNSAADVLPRQKQFEIAH
jgi:hypothetical protein